MQSGDAVRDGRRAALVAVAVALLGCSSAAPELRNGVAETAPPVPSPTKDPSSPVAPPTPAPAPVPDAGVASRARCGAAPYEWITSTSLGDVLESRSLAGHTPIELSLAVAKARDGAFKTRRIPKLGTKAKVVRYQTQDRGQLVDATASIAWPDVDQPRTFPILLVLHGTVGFNDGCSPSGGAADDALGGFMDGTQLVLALLSSLGYVVVAPDYLGLKSMGSPSPSMHPYLVGEPTAIASLDAVRAAKKTFVGANVTPGDLVVVGGSQGGHAAAFVNRFQPHYAPELGIKGSVWDVPPTDVLGQSRLGLAATTSGTDNVAAATAAFEDWYGASPNGLAGAFLAPYTTSIPQALATSCSPESVLGPLIRESVFSASYLSNGALPGFGGYAPWSCYMAENSLPTTSVPRLDTVPSLLLLGELDALVNNGVERASFQTLCAQGLTLSYLECAGATHTKPLTYAFDQWLDFLDDRLAGKPLGSTCQVRPAEKCTSTP